MLMLVLLQFISDAKQIKDNVFFSSLLLHYSEVIDGMGWDGMALNDRINTADSWLGVGSVHRSIRLKIYESVSSPYME